MVESIYCHVPFCAQKCEYCAFYSRPPRAELVQRYVRALLREMELAAGNCQPRTIFFGGGTPSLLSLVQWERILNQAAALGWSRAQEWTVECNPATISLDKARLLRSGGVSRISMGVQSLDRQLLERLGRIHSRAMVFKSFDILRQAGFDNVNLDLMFAIPGQSLEQWRATLGEALAMGSEHLSCYEVIYEEDTPLFAQLAAGEFSVDEELACAMYDELLDRASAAGFQQYEIANFGRLPQATLIPARACQHNLNYWRGGFYYGLGPSAAEFVDGVRTRNWSHTAFYCDQLERGLRAIESVDRLTPLARAGEIAAFGLRMNAGWPFEMFQATTGFDLRGEWMSEMTALVKDGFAVLGEGEFRLSGRGMKFADWAGSQFLRSEQKIERDEEEPARAAAG